LLDDAQTRIEALLRRDGYRDAKASYTRTLTDRGLVVTFNIARGPQFRVGSVAVTGSDGLPRELVTRLLAVANGAPYSQAQVNTGVAALRQEYYKRGYFKAQVPPTSTEAGPPAGNIAAMNVSVAVTEGPQAHVAEIVFEPAGPKVATADLRSVMRSKAGEPY